MDNLNPRTSDEWRILDDDCALGRFLDLFCNRWTSLVVHSTVCATESPDWLTAPRTAARDARQSQWIKVRLNSTGLTETRHMTGNVYGKNMGENCANRPC